MLRLLFLVIFLTTLLPSIKSLDVEWRKKAIPNRDADIVLPGAVVPNSQGINPTIVNGDEARRNSVPYQCALFIPVGTGNSFCGCSLINRRTVLTAAHCVDRVKTGEQYLKTPPYKNAVPWPGFHFRGGVKILKSATRACNTANLTIIFGAHNVYEDEATQQVFSSGTIFLHPNWTPSTLENDVAIVHLSTPVTINEYVRPILLPRNTDHDYVGNVTYVTGWGRPSDSVNTISPVLREVSLPVISNSACRLAYLGFVFPSTLCIAGAYGRGTCNGDSGGPLTLNGVQIGVVSFVSFNGCESGWPPGFARVTYFLDWINANTLPDETI